MKKYIKDILKLILFLALGLFFVWLSVKDLDDNQRAMIWTNIYNVFLDKRWIFLLLCMLIGILSVWFRAFRSILMIKPLGYQVSKMNSYHAIMICYLANLAFPRLGEVLRCTILQTHEKVPFQKSLGTVVAERIIDVLICGIMFVIALCCEYDKLMQIFVENHSMEKIMVFLSSKGKYVLIATLLVIALIIYLLRNKIKDIPFVKKIKSVIWGFWEGLISVKNVQNPIAFVIHSLGIWVCYYLMFYVCSFAFPEFSSLCTQTLLASLTCVVIGSVGFIVAQGGLGAYPLLISLVLSLYGLAPEYGLAIGWVIWTTENAMYLVLGLLSLVVVSLKKRKQ